MTPVHLQSFNSNNQLFYRNTITYFTYPTVSDVIMGRVASHEQYVTPNLKIDKRTKIKTLTDTSLSLFSLRRPNSQLVLSCTMRDAGTTWVSSSYRVLNNVESPCPVGVARQYIGYFFTQNAPGRIAVYNCSYPFICFSSVVSTSLPLSLHNLLSSPLLPSSPSSSFCSLNENRYTRAATYYYLTTNSCSTPGNVYCIITPRLIL